MENSLDFYGKMLEQENYMGQVIIEVPQNVYRSFQVDDSEFVEQLLGDLKDFEKQTKSEKSTSIIPPRRNSLREDGDAVLGIWSDNEEEAVEMAQKIRVKNNGKQQLETITLEYPYDLDDVDGSEALGIWADRKESAEDIAREIREKNRKVT